MNCEQFRACWSEWHADRLDTGTAAACAAERARCSDCARYDREMRALVAALGELPLPAAGTRASIVARRPRRWAMPALGMAAALVMAFAAGVLAPLPFDDTADGPVVTYEEEAVRVGMDEVETIHLAFASARAFDEVEFTIELPPGVELDGHPDERVITWSGQLREGRSRLSLPVRAERRVEPGGELVARIRHAGGTHELRVPLYPDANGGSGA